MRFVLEVVLAPIRSLTSSALKFDIAQLAPRAASSLATVIRSPSCSPSVPPTIIRLEAVSPLVKLLEDSDAGVRRAAVGGFAQTLEAVDRGLLSRDLDGIDPFLDPQQSVSEAFAQKAAARLELSLHEVRERYGSLAHRFRLHLEWETDG